MLPQSPSMYRSTASLSSSRSVKHLIFVVGRITKDDLGDAVGWLVVGLLTAVEFVVERLEEIGKQISGTE